MNDQSTDTVWRTESQFRMLANAERLLEDAELLFKANRFPSALSLAVLSMEEIGKLYIAGLCETEAEKQADPNRHGTKQQFAAVHLVHEPALKAFMDFLKSIDKPCDMETAQALLNELIKSEQEADTEEEKAKAAAIRKSIEDIIVASLNQSEVAEVITRIKNGEANRAKKRGFYCDKNADGSLSDPADITKDEADYWLDKARIIVTGAKFNCPQGVTSELRHQGA